jgi:hypothetical protein
MRENESREPNKRVAYEIVIFAAAYIRTRSSPAAIYRRRHFRSSGPSSSRRRGV